MLEWIIEPVNWLLLLWTIIGGPAIGVVGHNRLNDEGGSQTWARASGWLVAMVATPIVLGLSFGLYRFIGLPLAWKWFD